MKKLLILFMITTILLMAGCSKIKDLSKNLDEATATTENSNSQSETAKENTANNESSQNWPKVIPSDIPELKNVQIEGYYPLAEKQKEYQINFSIEKEKAQIVLDYIAKLTQLGYKQKYKTDNKFGFDYFGSNDKYDIFINVVYGGSSKIGITIK